MFVHVDLAVVLQLFCIVQGLTTGVYLLVARPKAASNRWLGLLLLGLTLQVVDYFLSRSGVYYRNRWLYFTPLFFSWAFGPLLWAYVQSLYQSQRRVNWAHFVLGGLQLLFYLAVSLQSFDTKTWFWLNVHKPYTRYLEHYVAVASMLVYLGLALRLVARQQRSPRWLWRLLLGLVGFYVAAALDPMVNAIYLPPGAPKFYLTNLVLPVMAYGLALLAFLNRHNSTQTRVQLPEARETPVAAAPIIEPLHILAEQPQITSAASAAVAPVVVPEYLVRVVEALEKEQLYKDPNLTLDTLARHVGLTANVVSQTINAGLKQSFYDVLNGYRLEEVKQRLLTDDARRLTVLALAFDAGFNSKTTFNRVFKEKTGLTPKEYQKKYHSTQWDDSVRASG
jgi:AraC-like DNA-binding protein